ncbi:MAG TPA: hypothetical protein V6C95_05760 [Coleofasciculaceae cyanobacterium]
MAELIAFALITCGTIFAIALSSSAQRGDEIDAESLILSTIDEFQLSAIRCEEGWKVGRLTEYYKDFRESSGEVRGYLDECAVSPTLQGAIEKWLRMYGNKKEHL